MLQATEIQNRVQYEPIYSYQEIVDAIALLNERLKKLEAGTTQSLEKEVKDLREMLYRQQLKMQRIEANLRIC